VDSAQILKLDFSLGEERCRQIIYSSADLNESICCVCSFGPHLLFVALSSRLLLLDHRLSLQPLLSRLLLPQFTPQLIHLTPDGSQLLLLAADGRFVRHRLRYADTSVVWDGTEIYGSSFVHLLQLSAGRASGLVLLHNRLFIASSFGMVCEQSFSASNLSPTHRGRLVELLQNHNLHPAVEHWDLTGRRAGGAEEESTTMQRRVEEQLLDYSPPYRVPGVELMHQLEEQFDLDPPRNLGE
jgi:hypothetical protein